MRSAGLPIDALIEYVGLVQRGDNTIEARKNLKGTAGAANGQNARMQKRWIYWITNQCI